MSVGFYFGEASEPDESCQRRTGKVDVETGTALMSGQAEGPAEGGRWCALPSQGARLQKTAPLLPHLTFKAVSRTDASPSVAAARLVLPHRLLTSLSLHLKQSSQCFCFFSQADPQSCYFLRMTSSFIRLLEPEGKMGHQWRFPPLPHCPRSVTASEFWGPTHRSTVTASDQASGNPCLE